MQQLDPDLCRRDAIKQRLYATSLTVEQGNLHKDSASSTVQLVMENGQVYPIKRHAAIFRRYRR